MAKRIYVAADHAGFELKEKMKTLLAGHGYDVLQNITQNDLRKDFFN